MVTVERYEKSSGSWVAVTTFPRRETALEYVRVQAHITGRRYRVV
ncbi:hypothetical protein ACIBI0_38640 [Microbispora rosea]